MKNSGLLIAAVVLAALTGALYWSNRHPASENTAKASIDTPPKILNLKQEDISKIEIKKRGGEELALHCNSTTPSRVNSVTAITPQGVPSSCNLHQEAQN